MASNGNDGPGFTTRITGDDYLVVKEQARRMFEEEDDFPTKSAALHLVIQAGGKALDISIEKKEKDGGASGPVGKSS